MKRVCSVLLICALLMAGLAVVASAAPASIAISVDKESYAVGGTVTATVKLNDYIENTWSLMTVAVRYDHEVLQYVNAVNKLAGDYTGGLQPSNDAENGILGLTWIGDALPAPGEDGAVAELTFTVLKAPESSIQLTAFFVEDGMALQGEKTPMENSSDGEPIYSTGEILSDTITIQPEGTDDSEESSKIITGGNDFAGGSATIAVKGNYVNNEDAKEDNYKVVIKWADFSYTFSNGKYWDVNTLSWKQNIDEEGNNIGTWGTVEPKNIEFTNYSSLPVTVTADYAVGQSGTFTFENNGATVAAVVDETDTLGEATIKATFEPGELTIDDTNVALGNIVVTIV